MLVQLPVGSPPPVAEMLTFTAAWLAATVFWLWTLRDCLVSSRVVGRAKLVWVVVLLCSYVVGAVMYLFFVRMRRGLPPKG